MLYLAVESNQGEPYGPITILTDVYKVGFAPLTPSICPNSLVSPPKRPKHRNNNCVALIAAGLSQPDEVPDDVLTPLSEEMRVQLAERLSSIGPLSDLIIQEREAV